MTEATGLQVKEQRPQSGKIPRLLVLGMHWKKGACCALEAARLSSRLHVDWDETMTNVACLGHPHPACGALAAAAQKGTQWAGSPGSGGPCVWLRSIPKGTLVGTSVWQKALGWSHVLPSSAWLEKVAVSAQAGKGTHWSLQGVGSQRAAAWKPSQVQVPKLWS